MTEPEPMIPLTPVLETRRRPGLISVTIASRRRPEKLTASIRSLRHLADDPGRVEFLVAYDPDDQETGRVARMEGAALAWEAPERFGFAHQSRYYAELLNAARGEWVLPNWSDDALMEAGSWDTMLREQKPCSIAYLSGNFPGITCFPAVHVDALAAIGRLTPLPAIDTWFENVGFAANAMVFPDIYVLQDRPDLTGIEPDETYLEGGGAWRELHGGPDPRYEQEPYVTWRIEDTMALRKARRDL